MAHVEVGAEIMTPPAKPEVEVLRATYYGECFLREQIDSILAQGYAQDCPALQILAREDGSKRRPPRRSWRSTLPSSGDASVRCPMPTRPGAPRPIFSN
jgi:hypothetical protein